MRRALAAFGTCALAAGLLAGCSDTPAPQNANPRIMPDQTSSNAETGSLKLFDSSARANPGGDSQTLGVNAYLWRGALETLKFMPLASADPFGGVIITDWWTPASASDERFKAIAYILGRQLRADGIRVSVFRQVQQNGQWVDAPVDPSKPTELENMVLAKARDLRALSAASR